MLNVIKVTAKKNTKLNIKNTKLNMKKTKQKHIHVKT